MDKVTVEFSMLEASFLPDSRFYQDSHKHVEESESLIQVRAFHQEILDRLPEASA
jgi:hypothetical protein